MTIIGGLGIFVFAMLAGIFFVIAVKIWRADDPAAEFEDAVRRRRNERRTG